MRNLAVRIVTVFGLLGLFCHCPCQSGLQDAAAQQSLANTEVYGAFFGEVARLNEAAGRAQLNGGIRSVVQPTPKDAIGLTDEEARILNELAADCASKNRLLTDAVRRLTWEARIRAMGSQDIPARLSQQLSDLDNQRHLMVLDHLQRLQNAIGDSRFQTLDGYVRSKEKAGSFFPPDSTGKPVAKKAAPLKK